MAAWIAPVSLPLPVPLAPKSRTLTWADSPVPRRTRERSNGAMSAPVLLKSARLDRLMSGFLQVSNQPQLVWISISWRQILRPIPEIVTPVTRSDESAMGGPALMTRSEGYPGRRFHPIGQVTSLAQYYPAFGVLGAAAASGMRRRLRNA